MLPFLLLLSPRHLCAFASLLLVQPLGIPKNLPELSLAYVSLRVHRGAQFFKTRDAFLHHASPVVTWGDDGGLYTVLMVDPDAPHPAADQSCAGKRGPWLHWLVTDCRSGTNVGGDELVAYEGPAPPKGNHRYIALLFRQTGEVVLPTEERAAWPFEQFLALNTHVLAPVAMNFFFTDAA